MRFYVLFDVLFGAGQKNKSETNIFLTSQVRCADMPAARQTIHFFKIFEVVGVFGGGAGYRVQNRTQREKSVSNMGVKINPKNNIFKK